MNPIVIAMVTCLAFSTASLAKPPSIEALAQRVKELERVVAEQQAQIQRLLDTSAKSATVAPQADTSNLESELAAELGLGDATGSESTPTIIPPPQASPSIVPVSGARGGTYLKLSLDGLFAVGGSSEPDVLGLQTGGHDPIQNGFTVQNVEMVLNGAVDPYFKGQANVVFQLDENGETIVELEEVYATTTSLPHGLQVKAGQYFTEFGRLNPTHPHTWDFVDQPLVNGRFFGGDGLRSAGARVSWLLPTPFFSQLYLSVQNPFGVTLTSFDNVEGETLFGRTLGSRDIRGLNDLLVVPRFEASFDPTENQTVLFGTSAALGPNATGDRSRTSIYGVDFFWKWKSPIAQKGFPFVKVQMEAMTRSYDAAADSEHRAQTFDDRGWYAQGVWGYAPRWLFGLRLEQVDGNGAAALLDPTLERRRRAATNLTWFPSEFSKLRLQYNRDDRALFRNSNSLWLQLEFLLGAHGAHKF